MTKRLSRGLLLPAIVRRGCWRCRRRGSWGELGLFFSAILCGFWRWSGGGCWRRFSWRGLRLFGRRILRQRPALRSAVFLQFLGEVVLAVEFLDDCPKWEVLADLLVELIEHGAVALDEIQE